MNDKPKDQPSELGGELKFSELRANMWSVPLRIPGIPRSQMLLDLIAGWSAFVNNQLDDEDGSASEDYPEDYADRLIHLYQAAGVLAGFDDPEMTPEDFLQRFVVPLFRNE
jgi:hypothetical protein